MHVCSEQGSVFQPPAGMRAEPISDEPSLEPPSSGAHPFTTQPVVWYGHVHSGADRRGICPPPKPPSLAPVPLVHPDDLSPLVGTRCPVRAPSGSPCCPRRETAQAWYGTGCPYRSDSAKIIQKFSFLVVVLSCGIYQFPQHQGVTVW